MTLRLFLLLFALPIPALATGVLRIPSEAAVEGRVITLGEISILDGLDPAQQARLSSFTLGPAAPPSKHRTFSGQALREQIAALEPELVLDVADRVEVHTAYREIQPHYLHERLEQAVRLRMPWAEKYVSFSDWRLPERFAVPVRAQRLVVRFRRNEDFLGRVSAQMELLDASDPKAPRVQRGASVHVTVRSPVVVTTRKMRRGEPLGEDSVVLEERELRSLRSGVLTELEQALGARLKQRVAEGTPLRISHLVSEPLVRRGDTVVVHGGDAGLDVRVEVRALQDGVRGQTIRVENRSTRHRFQVEITDSGNARLRLRHVGSGP